MPPKSPLPPRHGLQAAWVRTPDRDPTAPAPWPTMRDFLLAKLAVPASHIDDMLSRGAFVNDRGHPWTGHEPYRPHTFMWFHRDLRDEPEPPGELVVLHQDERIVVVDKPHFLATIPRGRHVLQSAVVKARAQLNLPELSAAHRLDRGTAGVLLMTAQRRWRAPYQNLFATRQVMKRYRVIARFDPALQFPCIVESHLVKRVGTFQVTVVDGALPNALTEITMVERRGELALYEAYPRTGRTHQIRAHFNQLGIPIWGDPLYPVVLNLDIDDFATPLQLLAHTLSFSDPIDATTRTFTSIRSLTWRDEPR